jgi:SWI/SNF-related matrix-associated actin-dependent regulator 1 of chromatin subfamily A
MIITAKFASTCPSCGKTIKEGSNVSWTRGTKAVHAECSSEGRAQALAVAASRAVETSALAVPAPEGRDYLPYQIAGVDYARSRGGAIIADEMGLGKTVQAIGVINLAEPRSVLVVCPKSLILNWKAELKAWLVVNPNVTVTNYEQLKKLPSNTAFDLMIVDEAHYCKNEKSARTKAVKGIARRCGRVLLLTGTPILNKPVELWPLLQIAAPHRWDPAGTIKGKAVGPGEGAGFFRFAKRYCDAREEWVTRTKKVWMFDGASNLEELQRELRASCMVRRLKKDVLTDLPAKRRKYVEIDAKPSAEEREWLGLSDDELARVSVEFAELSRVRHKSALAKVPAAIEYIQDALESSRKVVVFCHHKDVAVLLAEGLASHGVVGPVTGDMPAEDRQACVARFQSDETTRVIIGTYGAMGVGHTLTAASHVITVEQMWVPAEITQAEDRCHRIGQRESVLVEHLVAPGSLDSRMIQLIIAKQEVADLALDEIETEPEPGPETPKKAPLPELPVEEVEHIHRQLRYLSSLCDGAQVEDGAGFNKLDTNFGHELARQTHLTQRQARAAKKMLAKYRRQLETQTSV